MRVIKLKRGGVKGGLNGVFWSWYDGEMDQMRWDVDDGSVPWLENGGSREENI